MPITIRPTDESGVRTFQGRAFRAEGRREGTVTNQYDFYLDADTEPIASPHGGEVQRATPSAFPSLLEG